MKKTEMAVECDLPSRLYIVYPFCPFMNIGPACLALSKTMLPKLLILVVNKLNIILKYKNTQKLKDQPCYRPNIHFLEIVDLHFGKFR